MAKVAPEVWKFVKHFCLTDCYPMFPPDKKTRRPPRFMIPSYSDQELRKLLDDLDKDRAKLRKQANLCRKRRLAAVTSSLVTDGGTDGGDDGAEGDVSAAVASNPSAQPKPKKFKKRRTGD